MAWTPAVLSAAHQEVLDLLNVGAGTDPTLDLYAGATLLASIPIDHATSSINAGTGQLTLAPKAGGTTAVASGTVTIAKLADKDGLVLETGIPVSQGIAPVSGQVVLSSLAILSGGQVDLISCTIG